MITIPKRPENMLYTIVGAGFKNKGEEDLYYRSLFPTWKWIDWEDFRKKDFLNKENGYLVLSGISRDEKDDAAGLIFQMVSTKIPIENETVKKAIEGFCGADLVRVLNDGGRRRVHMMRRCFEGENGEKKYIKLQGSPCVLLIPLDSVEPYL